ncbi:nuclear pore complex protein [Malassezia pachydermatis]|uniref:Nuclear pore complex protein n=1 Tax=Malassezia pachydermatis TaxID=77020 RepID=A0A0M9VQ43_9BASI|nr:nuclear pore complex protein [Malassezia pachydermatis]KOS15115.1 nuclear pore complex protein [Malassezia pachydermatis]
MRTWREALQRHALWEHRSDVTASEADTAQRTSLLAMRGADMLAVVQNQVRMTNVAQAKRQFEEESEIAPSYKILSSSLLDFPIQALAVNPTGKLLAVVGAYTMVLIILPRRGYMKQVGTHILVKAVRIGSYYHGLHGCPRIAQCAWHPLGMNGTSLMVLTDDGLLREYDVAQDVEEPAQTVSVLSQATTPRSKAAWSADDDDEQCAVAMAFGPQGLGLALPYDEPADHTDEDRDASWPSWLLFTVFVLTRSGDIVALCPYMPRHAMLPRRALLALAASEAREQEGRTLAVRYLSDLVQQATTAVNHDEDAAQDDASTTMPAWLPVTAPASVPHRIAPQGPFLQRPSPLEGDDELGPSACDLWLTCVRADQGQTSLPVLCLAERDGRMHNMVLATTMRPQWVSSIAESGTSSTPTPTLAVYECLDLGLPVPRSTLLTTNYLRLVPDPLYPDTVFVSHGYGAHVVSIQPWASALADAMQTQDKAQTHAAVQAHTRSDVSALVRLEADDRAPMAGMCVLNDVYVSYTLFVCTSDAQLAALELRLRSTMAWPEDEQAREINARGYQSVLTEPFVTPTALTHAGKAVAATSAPLTVTPATLRALGQAAEALRQQTRDVAQAGQAVQTRVAQQLAEMQRQVTQLADLAQRAAALRTETVAARLDRMEAAQQASVRRLDTLLQHLMDEHTPQLSVYEKRWFDELQRMSREFTQDGRTSAKEHLLKLSHQLDVLRPHLRSYAEQHAVARGQQLGTKQQARIESTLAKEAQLLAQARVKVQRLQQALQAHKA